MIFAMHNHAVHKSQSSFDRWLTCGDISGWIMMGLVNILRIAFLACIIPNPCRSAGQFFNRFAVLNNIVRIMAGVRAGLISSNCAMTELTIGAAKEVPSTCI